MRCDCVECLNTAQYLVEASCMLYRRYDPFWRIHTCMRLPLVRFGHSTMGPTGIRVAAFMFHFRKTGGGLPSTFAFPY
jgi:hypothetical protein